MPNDPSAMAGGELNASLNHFYPRQLSSAPSLREKANALGMIAFVAVLCTTLFDLNSLLFAMTDRQQLASPILLVCCLISFVAFRFQFIKSLGLAGSVFVASYLMFIAVGCMSRLLGDFDQTEIYILTYFLRMHLTSVVIVLAAALGARYFALRFSPEKALLVVLVVASLQVLAVLFSRQLGDVVLVGEKHQKFESIGRATGFLGDPNLTGNLMAAVIAIGFGCLVSDKWKIPVLLCMGAAAVGCIMTFSRSAWIAVFLVGASQIFYSPVVRKKSALVGSAAIAIGIVWFVLQGANRFELSDQQKDRVASFTEIMSGDYDELDTGNRFVQAAIGMKKWASSPLFGHGLGKGSRMETEYGLTLGTHNHFILLLVEAGILGLIPYLFFFAIATWVAWKSPSDAVKTFSLGYLVAFVCHNLTGHNVTTENFHAALLGVMFGLLSAVNYAAKRQKRMRPPRTSRQQHPALTSV